VKIDIHAHIYSPEYLDLLEDVLAGPAGPLTEATKEVIQRKVRGNPAMWQVQPRLGLMDQLEVNRQVLSLSLPQVYEGDLAVRRKLARMSNDYFAEVVTKNPGRFLAFASLPLPDVDASLAELTRCMDELGMVGVCLGAHVSGQRLDDPDFAPVFDEIDRRGLVVFLHPMSPECSGMLTDFNLGPTLGYIFDTGVTVYRMIFSGMLERYQRMRLIVPHLGGMLPYLIGRVDNTYRTHPSGKKMQRSPTEYMRELYYDSVSNHPPALRLAAEVFGIERLLFGTDYPFGVDDIELGLQSIRDAGFSAAEQAMILGENACRLIGEEGAH